MVAEVTGDSATGWRDLLAAALGDASELVRAASAVPWFDPPFARLASTTGWAVWLGHPPVPDLGPVTGLPAPPAMLWDDPRSAMVTAAGVALNYARRRGAIDPATIDRLLRREGPVAIVVPDTLDPSLRPLLAELDGLAMPILVGADDIVARLAAVPSFAARRLGHATPLNRDHDPALAFQDFAVAERIGGNSLSSFVLHHEAERDGVSVVGSPSARFGLEVGVGGAGVGLAETAALERAAATYPGFLDGVAAREEGHSLEIGWRDGSQPEPRVWGEAVRVWLKALDGVDAVDVRIVFAPAEGRSAVLTDMRARAAAFKELRDAAIVGTPIAANDPGRPGPE